MLQILSILGCLHIQPNQFPEDFQEISRTHIFNSRRFSRDKPYNIKMQMKFVMSEDLLFKKKVFCWHLVARVLTPEIIVILFTRGLPYVQCTKNHLTCKNYIANYFQEHQLNFRRFPVFPGLVYTLYVLNKLHPRVKITVERKSRENEEADLMWNELMR